MAAVSTTSPRGRLDTPAERLRFEVRIILEALLVALRHDLEEEVCRLLLKRQVSDLVVDEELRHRHRSVHHLRHVSLSLRGLQRDDEVGGRHEADLPALMRSDESEGDGKVCLTGARRTSVIMPGARRLKLRSFILSIHGTARWSSRLDASAMLASSILLFGSGTAPSPYYQPGWLSHGCLPSRC